MARTPRLDNNKRLLFRLWEALCLAYFVRPVRGPPLVTHYDSTSRIATRRRFVRNLAFICDYKKGGVSSTSVSVEEDDDCFRFWVSANQGVESATLKFLKSILNTVTAHQVDPEALARDCISFCRQRVYNNTRRLANASTKCRIHLDAESGCQETYDVQRVVSWLQRFEFSPDVDLYAACHQAYEARHDQELRLLKILSRDPDDGTNAGNMAKTLRSISHFVGRLAAYIRVPKELLEDASRLGQSHIFDGYQVAAVQMPVPAPVPEADSQTNLECILGRMLRDRGHRFSEILSKLTVLDSQVNLEARIRHKFSGGIEPCVHAEIQMLEHFHCNGLKFAESDKYIACSKPACLACKLYFEHHRAMPVRLDSHEKIYPNWAPAVLPAANGDPRFIEQRELLTAVIRIICNISLQQIDQTIVSSEWHPDSLTMITQEDYMITTSPANDTTEESTDDESGVGEGTMGHHFTSFDAWRDIEEAMEGLSVDLEHQTAGTSGLDPQSP